MHQVPFGRSPFPYNVVCGASFTVHAIDTNAITINVQLLNQNHADLQVGGRVNWWISDDAFGNTLATALTGGVAAGTDGLVISTLTGRYGWAKSEEDGDIDFVLTDSGNATKYLCLEMPDGSIVSQVVSFLEPGTG